MSNLKVLTAFVLSFCSMSVYATIDVYFKFPLANQFTFNQGGIVDHTQVNCADNDRGASVLKSQVSIPYSSNPLIKSASGPATFLANTQYCIPDVTIQQLSEAVVQPFAFSEGSGSLLYVASTGASFTVTVTAPTWITYQSVSSKYYLTGCQYDTQHGVPLMLCLYQ